MTTSPIRVGSRVNWSSKTHEGRGKVLSIDSKRTGAWATVQTKDHPAGVVTVRLSQVRR